MDQSFFIQIKSPCSENWGEMTLKEQGRYCSQCEKTVIDFSKMNDTDLFNYFNTNSNFCGRFKHSQVERIITKPVSVHKRIFNFYSKTVAMVLTFISFKSVSTVAQNNPNQIENFVPKPDEVHKEKIYVEGTIVDDENKVINDVDIFMDNIRLTSSNHLGYYKLELDSITIKNHIISYSKENYRSSSISFHPLMGNIKNDVNMCNYSDKQCSGYIMGAPVAPRFNTIYISKYNDKIALNDLARKLRENPNVAVIIKLYYSRKHPKKLIEKNGKEILNYLVNNQGIDKERLIVRITENPHKANKIEISLANNH